MSPFEDYADISDVLFFIANIYREILPPYILKNWNIIFKKGTEGAAYMFSSRKFSISTVL